MVLPILWPTSSSNTATLFDELMSIPTNRLLDIMNHTPFILRILAFKGVPVNLIATASLRLE